MNMSTRTLGRIAMVTSPFLGIDFMVNGFKQTYHPTVLSGVFSLLYMTGWVCSIVALYRFQAAGTRPQGKAVLYIQLLLLTLGEVRNVYSIIEPTATNTLFRTLDLSWPVSNCFMFFTGIAVLAAKKFPGWKRYIPFVVGVWFPITLVLIPMLFGQNTATILTSAIYSTTAWFFMGYMVYITAKEKVRIDLNEAIRRYRATA